MKLNRPSKQSINLLVAFLGFLFLLSAGCSEQTRLRIRGAQLSADNEQDVKDFVADLDAACPMSCDRVTTMVGAELMPGNHINLRYKLNQSGVGIVRKSHLAESKKSMKRSAARDMMVKNLLSQGYTLSFDYTDADGQHQFSFGLDRSAIESGNSPVGGAQPVKNSSSQPGNGIKSNPFI